MKIKNFTLIAIAAAILVFPACKKLTNGSIVLGSNAISAKFKSGTVSQVDINSNINLATFVDKDVDVYKRLTEGVDLAKTAGYTATETGILEGKISKVIIKNDDPADTRSFRDYFEKINKIYVKFTDVNVPYDSMEDKSVANGYVELSDTIVLSVANTNSITIDIPVEKQKNLKNFLREQTPVAEQKRSMIVVVNGVCKQQILPGEEFKFVVNAVTDLSLTPIAK